MSYAIHLLLPLLTVPGKSLAYHHHTKIGGNDQVGGKMSHKQAKVSVTKSAPSVRNTTRMNIKLLRHNIDARNLGQIHERS